MELAIVIINALMLVALGAGGFVIKELSRRLEVVEQKQAAMQVNYLDRFADAKTHTTTEVAKILEAVNNLKLEFAQKK